MSYSGLRGAVGFSLVVLISNELVPAAPMFKTTTLVVVIFTVFFQGSTIKPLVKLLDIKLQNDSPKTLHEDITENIMDHIMEGIETIAGKTHGQARARKKIERFDDDKMMKVFVRPDYEGAIASRYEHLSLSDHLINLYAPSSGDLDQEKTGEENQAFINDKESDIVKKHKKNKIFSEEDRQSLRRAFSDAPFAKVRRRFNKNLIQHEDQDVDYHLKKRKEAVQKITAEIFNENIQVQSGSQKSGGEQSALSGIGSLEQRLADIPPSERESVAAVMKIHEEKRQSKKKQPNKKPNGPEDTVIRMDGKKTNTTNL